VIGKSSVQPDTFAAPITFFIWTVLILGGAGRVWSPIVGSMIFWGDHQLHRDLRPPARPPDDLIDTEPDRPDPVHGSWACS
jgi:neutral amino acid transport system permease protein